MKQKIFVDGEHGTTGLQILSRLQQRDDIELLSIAHEDRHDQDKRRSLLNAADIAILCLPDEAAKEAVIMVDDETTRFIDASTAHRTHSGWTFGFKELEPGHAEKIARSRLVSNPGCYSTGAIALLRPLVQTGMLPNEALVTINAVSGYTGGGKGLIAQMENSSADNAITAPHFLYATQLHHKHVPEITTYSLLEHAPVFSPSVGRFPQGMMVQVPLHMEWLGAHSPISIHAALEKHYHGGEHVRVVPLPESAAVERLDPTMLAGQDTMDLHVFGNEEQVNLVAVLDNLGKGASGACVQALDLMLLHQS